MHLPSITSAYLAVLALLYTVLAVQVGRLRQRDRAAFGDNGSLALRSAIRAHANFIEYVPDHRADGRDAGNVRPAPRCGSIC